MCGAPLVRAVSSFSLFLLLVVTGLAADYAQLSEQLRAMDDPAEGLRHIVRSLPEGDELRGRAEEALQNGLENSRRYNFEDLRDKVELRASAQVASADEERAIKGDAQQIKRNPLYRDEGVTESSNWLSGIVESILKMLRRAPKAPNMPNVPSVQLNWLIYVFWALLGGALIFFLYWVIRTIQWKRTLARKSKALLDEDEPERTLDEWLALADKLESEGKYREAVRCLYLACLLKFDEHKVARFQRGETNWEHLSRIRKSPLAPADLDFTSPTKEFDRIWYGKIVRGQEDVRLFRDVYVSVSDALYKGKAA